MTNRSSTAARFLPASLYLVAAPRFAQTVTLSQPRLSFGNQVQGTSSSAQKITLKNGQPTASTITSITTSLSDKPITKFTTSQKASSQDADGYGGNALYIDRGGPIQINNNLIYRTLNALNITLGHRPPGRSSASITTFSPSHARPDRTTLLARRQATLSSLCATAFSSRIELLRQCRRLAYRRAPAIWVPQLDQHSRLRPTTTGILRRGRMESVRGSWVHGAGLSDGQR